MLSLENVSLEPEVDEKKIPILKDVNIDLKAGKMYAFTGPNGSGKSSVARVAMGIFKLTAGKVFYNDEDVSAMSITEEARRGIDYAFQQPPRFKGMRVIDMLKAGAGPDSRRG